MSRNRYGGLGEDPYMNGSSNGYSNGNGYGSARNGSSYGGQITEDGDYEPYNERYGTPPPRQDLRTPSPSMPRTPRSRGLSRPREPVGRPRADESNAERQIGEVLEQVKQDWPAMCENECVPVQLALQLLDTSSVGRAHELDKFHESMQYLQDSLKNIVHEHHQGFNSSIGTFHKIQTSIQTSQKRVRTLKDSLAQSKANLSTSDPELRKLGAASTTYDELLHTLSEVEDLRLVPDQLEARISEKRFLTAVDVLQDALRRIRSPELDDIGALSELRSYLTNQETALTDILIEELHDHLYLKSPYCQERWQMLAKTQGGIAKEKFENTNIRPFFEVLESLDQNKVMVEDPSRNPEADTFYYLELLTEALNKLGRLENAVNTIRQRLPVELFGIVNETNSEVDQKHPSSLRGGLSGTQGNQTFSGRENTIRADVIYDLLWTLYAKFEAIAEGHRFFNDVVKAITRREGIRNPTTLLGGFRELWNLYQNEIRSLLHNYVTTDADVYHFNSPRMGASRADAKLERLFKFSDADAKSVHMTTEYDELEGIIRAAVPGLMSESRKSADARKTKSLLDSSLSRSGTKRLTGGMNTTNGGIGAHKSLVEPSVFNMSLLLPPTLTFLQRLKAIVPPGSDVVTSTLTSFLDNFLVNVFLPQLEETLGKLSDSVFEENNSFQEDSQWASVSRRPIFKGTAAFFELITAFCRMLDTIPHDQALSQLIITQMMRYYDRCYDWFRSLVSRVQDSEGLTLKISALFASEPGEIHDTMVKIWRDSEVDRDLLEQEAGLLILHTNETPLNKDDVITDREIISSLCVLYTSMKWLAIKIGQLRHITRNDVDSSRPTMQKPHNRRWTLLNDPHRVQDEQPVYLPMTQETVVAFDSIVSSYQELAINVLLTLHLEIRCQIIHYLTSVLVPNPSHSSPYILAQEVLEPDPVVLSLNAELAAYDETIARFLREKEIGFIRSGLALLIDTFLVGNAGLVQRINRWGAKRMRLNVLVLQQNLKNIEEGVDLQRAGRYWDLFGKGADAVVEWAKGQGEEERFSEEELRMLVELFFSEQVSSADRGVSTAGKRGVGEVLARLEEVIGQA
ncbi:sec8 exocyst complex component specific domain-containing protein [Rutstroemia sp. NJR-2017a WRK4]|nr:sec8 exocyst complex component specific domain-containing protein [Rutstroemia sp. NJR-2017a WRK4]